MQMWCDDHLDLVYVQPAPALERDGGDHCCRPLTGFVLRASSQYW
jgi:hypothetical protein